MLGIARISYRFDMQYRSSAPNANADLLSRLPVVEDSNPRVYDDSDDFYIQSCFRKTACSKCCKPHC